MTTEQINNTIKFLKQKGVQFDNGLTEAEVLQIESKFDFIFPPDYKLFLKASLPISDEFVNWRLGIKSKEEFDKIIELFNEPLEGMLFDIESNNFWFDSWGEKPIEMNERFNIARKFYKTYPKLIPIFAHRYIPSTPNKNNNPIFSVWQMDIIYYGVNLESYFANEFEYTKSGNYELDEFPHNKIEFWSSIAESENPYNTN